MQITSFLFFQKLKKDAGRHDPAALFVQQVKKGLFGCRNRLGSRNNAVRDRTESCSRGQREWGRL